mmetsp:Transcript_20014/g.36359  ORF Transcript_20014/g.36359 Transcript_20014/m.36359 type:complete len:80 (-) Transcript_20014:417-656(-)
MLFCLPPLLFSQTLVTKELLGKKYKKDTRNFHAQKRAVFGVFSSRQSRTKMATRQQGNELGCIISTTNFSIPERRPDAL